MKFLESHSLENWSQDYSQNLVDRPDITQIDW